MGDFRELISSYAALLPVNSSISYTEAERRAGEFLVACAKITEFRHIFSEDKIRLTSVEVVTLTSELSKTTGKTITENKMTAESSPDYIKAREDLERIQTDIDYLKAYYDIFTSAHVFYRQMARGETA